MTQQPNQDWIDALKREHPYEFDIIICILDILDQRGMLVPEGWVAVPLEPTSLMKIDGQQKINQIFNTAKHLMREAGEIYHAMLAAAPKMERKE